MKRPLQLRGRQIPRGTTPAKIEDHQSGVSVSGSQESKKPEPATEKEKENENPNSQPDPTEEPAGAAVDPESQPRSSATSPFHPLDRSASSSTTPVAAAGEQEDLAEGRCTFCGQEGNLVSCDGCQRGFHYLCTKLSREEIRKIPVWYCEDCSKASSSSSSSSSNKRPVRSRSGPSTTTTSTASAGGDESDDFEPAPSRSAKRARNSSASDQPSTPATPASTSSAASTTAQPQPAAQSEPEQPPAVTTPARTSSIQVINSTNITALASQHTGRASATSRVQGPTSALSSFLAERGIQARGLNRWRPRNAGGPTEAANENGEEVTPDPSDSSLADTSAAAPARRSQSSVTAPQNAPSTYARRSRSTSEAASPASSEPSTPGVRFEYVMEVRRKGKKAKGKGEEDDDFQEAPARSRKGKQKAQEDEKAKAKAKEKYLQEKAQKKKEKQKAKEAGGGDPGDSSSSDSDDSDDEYEFRRVAVCGSCGTQFPDGVLRCPKCSVNKRTPQASRKKNQKASVGAILRELRGQIKPLQELCIEFICKNIDCVESFGDIASDVFEKISMLTCKMRLLTETNIHLFVGPNIDRLRLCDCADLTVAALGSIAKGCPSLKVLELNRCGRMTDAVLAELSDGCPKITHFTLGGAFLVTDQAFVYFIKGHPHLKSFVIENAPRAGVETLKAVSVLTEATTISFANCSSFTDEYMPYFSPPSSLRELTVSHNTQLTDDGISSLLDRVLASKAKLTALDLSGCLQMTDSIAKKIAANFPQLTELSLEGSQITDEGMIEIAGSCHSLKKVSLKRSCIGNDSLQALAVNCGKNLLSLDINGLLDITEDSLLLVAENCPNMEELDISWQRAANDLVLGKFLTSAPNLFKISIWGCNKLTECAFAPRAGDVGRSLKVLGQFIC